MCSCDTQFGQNPFPLLAQKIEQEEIVYGAGSTSSQPPNPGWAEFGPCITSIFPELSARGEPGAHQQPGCGIGTADV